MRRFLIPLLAVFALPTEINAEDYPHHLDMTKTDRNYWINVCKGNESITGKKKACDSMGLFDDGYYVWDENRSKRQS